MNDYSLIALDMDGTLLNSELRVTPRTLDAVRRALSAGKHVVLSTGRCLSEIRDTIRDLDGIRYLVCESGACVYDRRYDRTIHLDPVPTEEVCVILKLIRGERCTVEVFSENQSYVNQPDDRWLDAFRVGSFRETFNRCTVWDAKLFRDFDKKPFRIEKVNLYFDSDAARTRIARALSDRPLGLVNSFAYMLEIISDRADKGRGLKMLCEHLKLPLARTIAVGDSLNDIEVLKVAGFSVAMGNACPEAKAVADFVTDDCDHDGVARVIDEYLLKEE